MTSRANYRKTTFGNGPLSKVVRLLFRYTVGPAAFAFSRLANPDAMQTELTQVTLPLPRLHPAFDGYRLAQISDFHLGTYINGERLLEAIAQVNRLKPDLVVITGDFVTYDPRQFETELVGALRRLQAPDGAAAILGNHDHWTDPVVVRRHLRAARVRTLTNQAFTVKRGGAALHIVGLDDWIEECADLERALHGLPPEGAAILLVHEPDFADLAAANGRFDLQLSGHTHGGQICLPGLGALITPPRGHKYPQGLRRVGSMWQYTNRGLGTAELQVRWNCRPEITLFTLKAIG